ncbi:hypothetical protein CBR_g11977 [Chara braunii]|uniref:Expansin-like EG45 domain-containing protein n=1 Tax=Chara braunii TaxID=69332 RepID=A0A388KQU0_CHABU|nr:hypothetical protein CBR_g11977 [Chara braunii]|eukprot:GBG72399.1 hypothetical protein CBR_g11977 [Chara braunii]
MCFIILGMMGHAHGQANNTSADGAAWTEGATLTFYGDANGGGTLVGACGYGNLLATPCKLMIAAGNPPMFEEGFGCGRCWEIRCVGNPGCTATVTITMTHLCPCGSDTVHFDMSQPAFHALASGPAEAEQLVTAGKLQGQYRRVLCDLGLGKAFTAIVREATNPSFLSILMRDIPGAGDIKTAECAPGGGSTFSPMTQDFGAMYNFNGKWTSPVSLGLTLGDGQILTGISCIPAAWKPATTYTCK